MRVVPLLLVCPQGCNRRKYEITVCFGTGNLELSGGTSLCRRVIVFFVVLCFLFLFQLFTITRHPLSCMLGFTPTFFALRLSVAVYFIGKFLLVLQERFFRLKTLITFAALEGVEVISLFWGLGVHCNAMAAKS